jgi:circadian clock protein KaiB
MAPEGRAAHKAEQTQQQDGSMTEEQPYILSLYVTGATPRSLRAIANIKRICEEYLQGRYELEVVDIYQQPELAQQAEIVAAPALIKELPVPLRTLVGDMSDEEQVLIGLGLRHKPTRPPLEL